MQILQLLFSGLAVGGLYALIAVGFVTVYNVTGVITVSEEPGGGWLVIGRVRLIHVADDLYRDGKIDTRGLRPVGRLAGHSYLTLTGTFEMRRPGP